MHLNANKEIGISWMMFSEMLLDLFAMLTFVVKLDEMEITGEIQELKPISTELTIDLKVRV